MHKNNFDFFRLVFATMVMVTHSYALTGVPGNDLCIMCTKGQMDWASLGVDGFFIISGYLILQSVQRSHNWGDYMVKRILRIYPGFFVVLLFAVFLCFFISGMAARAYFFGHSAWAYVINNLSLFRPQQYGIYQVFSSNPYKYAVNGSIWTIPYEFLFYLILSLTFILKKRNKLLITFLLLGYAVFFLLNIKYYRQTIYLNISILEVSSLSRLGLYFFGGAILAAVRISELRYKMLLLVASVVLCVLLVITRHIDFGQYIVLPFIIILAGTYATKGIAGLNKKIGDFSYGIYLYGFIIQQTLVHYFAFNYWQLMLISIPVTFVFGALSWYLVEKRALALKKYFR